MAIYKLNKNGNIVRISDGMTIPADPTLFEYQQYLKWRATGSNTPQPFPVDVNETIKTEIAKIEAANPLTHRMLREFFIAASTVMPATQQLPTFQKILTIDNQIQDLRGQLQK